MDAAALPWVEELSGCKCAQSGFTESAHNFVGWACDYAPGPVMYCFPDELMAKDNSAERVLPMFKSSRRLSEYLTGVQDDEAKLNIKLRHMKISFAWSSSASRLGNKPVRYVIGDEYDKWQQPVSGRGGQEPSALSLLVQRMNTYRALGLNKMFLFSTPAREKNGIHERVETAPARFDFHVVCPVCGTEQLMHWGSKDSKGGYRLPEGMRDPEKIYEQNLAWYECAGACCRWDDHMKKEAVKRGQWRERVSGLPLMEHLHQHKPRRIGFHLPAWISPFITIGQCAKAFLTDLKEFTTQYEATPWKAQVSERSEDVIAKLKDARPRGLVPGSGQVACITAAVDTQDTGFWYEVRAWGWGLDGPSWQVREGFVLEWEALDRILWADDYRDSSGMVYVPALVVQDAMGHRTAEVYNFCLRHRGQLLPSQGVERMRQPYSFSALETWPGSGKAIPGGLRLVRANVTHYKNLLANKLEIAAADPGAWLYHRETTDEWIRHMTAEYRNDEELWECRSGRANHGWDCSVLNLVAADIIGVKHWQKPVEAQRAEAGEQRSKEKQVQNDWINRGSSRGGWLR